MNEVCGTRRLNVKWSGRYPIDRKYSESFLGERREIELCIPNECSTVINIINAMSYGKTDEEITEVLTNAKFVDISFYGFYRTDSQLRDDSRRIIVVAKKP